MMMIEYDYRLAEAVRAACKEAFLQAYEDAGLSGLCQEGRIEYALSALERLDLQGIVNRVRKESPPSTDS